MVVRHTGLCSALVMLACASNGEAQSSVSAPPKLAILAGAVLDSIRGGYLEGATVFVSGTSLSATTDSSGHFRIAAIPAGIRRLQLQHPLLDSLRITLVTESKTFIDGDSSFLVLSVPSARTYVESMCSAPDREKGQAIVVGTVTDAASGKGSSDATVSISWTDFEIGKHSIRTLPQRRVVKVSSDGNFHICGLPGDLSAAVVASRPPDSTAGVAVKLASLVETVALKLPPPRGMNALDSSTAVPAVAGNASVSGHVVSYDRKPVAGARVAIDDDDAVTATNADGAFTLVGLRPGTRRITARKIGLEPAERAVDVQSDEMNAITLSLGRSVAVLKQVVVSAQREIGLQRVGFAERRRKQSGVFFSPKDVDIRNGAPIARLLETVHILKRACMRYFIDGHMQAEGDPDEYMSGAEVGAVEVYSPSFVPSEFVGFTNGQACGAVVIWTKWKIAVLR